MEHTLYEPEGKEGIYICSVCRGAEASLPTDCPGEAMSADRQDEVQFHKMDYLLGQWVKL